MNRGKPDFLCGEADGLKSSLAKRLSVILLLTTLIILLGVGYGYFTVYRNSMNEQSMRYARDIVRDTTKDLESYVDDLKHSAEILAAQPDIYGFLNADTPRRFELKNTVRAQLASFANYKHGVVNVYMRSVGGMTLSASPDDARRLQRGGLPGIPRRAGGIRSFLSL